MISKQYVSAKQLAERFIVSTRTIYRWSGVDGFPSHFKFHGKNYWRVAETERWERDRQEQARQEWAASKAEAKKRAKKLQNSLGERG